MPLYSTLAALSQTAASNPPDGTVDAPSTIDDQLRLLGSFIAQLRDGNGVTSGAFTPIQNQTYTYFTTGGTTSAFTLTPTPAITAYTAGQSFFVTFNAANLANATLAISGLASPPNLVKQIADGTFANLAVADVPLNHRSRVTLISTTQAWVETLPDVSLGRGQTVQDVTASRALATTYTNSTGRPIFVHVRLTTSSAALTSVSMTINGTVGFSSDTIAISSVGVHISAIVPAGATYKADAAGGGGTLGQWFEVR